MDRRQYLAVVGIALSAGCASNESSSRPESSNRTPTSDSTPTPDSTVRLESPPGEFQSLSGATRWEYEFNEDSRSIPVAVGDGVYAVEVATLTHLSPDGTVQWTVDSSTAFRSNLVATGDAVYHLSNSKLASYEPASGDERWTQRIRDAGRLSTSDVTEEGVYVSQTTDDPSAILTVLAFDADTGEERWRTETGMEMGSTVSHGLWLVYSLIDGLTALDTATGDVQWQRDLGEEYGVDVRAVGDTLCLFTNGTVHGYALPDGTHQWEQSLPGDERIVQPGPSGVSQTADFYIADDKANLTALNATTGDKQWDVTTNWGDEGNEGMCLGTDSLFYHSGTALARYDLVDGTRRWAYSLGPEYGARQPFIANETVFLVGQERDGHPSVRAFDAETGRRQWRSQLTTEDPSPPRVSGVFDEYAVLTTENKLIGIPVTPSTV